VTEKRVDYLLVLFKKRYFKIIQFAHPPPHLHPPHPSFPPHTAARFGKGLQVPNTFMRCRATHQFNKEHYLCITVHLQQGTKPADDSVSTSKKSDTLRNFLRRTEDGEFRRQKNIIFRCCLLLLLSDTSVKEKIKTLLHKKVLIEEEDGNFTDFLSNGTWKGSVCMCCMVIKEN